MSCQAPLLVAIMVFALFALYMLGLFYIRPISCASEPLCPSGRLCPAHWLCCEEGCCAPPTDTLRRITDEPLKESHYDYAWYAQWSVMCLLATLVGVLVCCICCVCRRSSHGVYMVSLVWRLRRRPTSDHDSAGSVYPPPRYSRCGSFHNAPPRYSEVTSKPDLYPLVITCGEGDGKAGGNYLLVHYFRNYVSRAPGSLSAASTAESLNSSFICNAANEANSIIPPPYSRTQTYDEFARGRSLRSLCSLSERERPRTRQDRPHETTAFRENLITSPVQPLDSTYDLELELMDCEMYCDGDCKPRLGSSPPVHRSTSNVEESYEPEPYRLRHMYSCPSPDGPDACESPPQPTSPTQTSRDSTLRRPSDERWQRRLDNAKKMKLRKSSLYMPLSVAYPVRQSRVSPSARASSRSAPATPCSSLVPNLLTFTQRVTASRHSSRSSKCPEESNPLLTEMEERTDHKF